MPLWCLVWIIMGFWCMVCINYSLLGYQLTHQQIVLFIFSCLSFGVECMCGWHQIILLCMLERCRFGIHVIWFFSVGFTHKQIIHTHTHTQTHYAIFLIASYYYLGIHSAIRPQKWCLKPTFIEVWRTFFYSNERWIEMVYKIRIAYRLSCIFCFTCASFLTLDSKLKSPPDSSHVLEIFSHLLTSQKKKKKKKRVSTQFCNVSRFFFLA